jgi:type II secretory pathway pseudopilin PulG
MARTAVIAGTATATSNAVNRRQAEKNVAAYGNAQQQYYDQQGVASPPVAVGAGPSPATVVAPPVAAAPAPAGDLTSELQRLGDLKAQGILTDEEFSAAKKKLLGL